MTGRLIGSPGDAAAVLDRTLDVAAIALAAEQLGGAQRALDMAVEYAKVRQQFGRPIGSFQAIKHRCADLLLEVESLRSAVGYAAAAVAEDSAEVPVLASLVKAYASETYFHVAAENIQIHGGIGFTWEHDAHLYFKRAKSSELFLGDGSLPPRAAGHPHRPVTPCPFPGPLPGPIPGPIPGGQARVAGGVRAVLAGDARIGQRGQEAGRAVEVGHLQVGGAHARGVVRVRARPAGQGVGRGQGERPARSAPGGRSWR